MSSLTQAENQLHSPQLSKMNLQGCKNKHQTTMKQLFLQLLAMLLALARTPPEEEESIAKQQNLIQRKKDEIKTFHGDSELASPEAFEAYDDLAKVGASSTPDPEYAEVPDLPDEDGDGTPDEQEQAADAGGAEGADAGETGEGGDEQK